MVSNDQLGTPPNSAVLSAGKPEGTAGICCAQQHTIVRQAAVHPALNNGSEVKVIPPTDAACSHGALGRGESVSGGVIATRLAPIVAILRLIPGGLAEVHGTSDVVSAHGDIGSAPAYSVESEGGPSDDGIGRDELQVKAQ